MARVKRTRKTIDDAGWQLTPELRAWARFHCPQVNVDRETENFIDYWKGHGKPMADWDATFRVWMRRVPQFSRPAYGRGGNARPMATVEMPYERGERTPGPPVLLKDHPLFKGIKGKA